MSGRTLHWWSFLERWWEMSQTSVDWYCKSLISENVSQLKETRKWDYDYFRNVYYFHKDVLSFTFAILQCSFLCGNSWITVLWTGAKPNRQMQGCFGWHELRLLCYLLNCRSLCLVSSLLSGHQKWHNPVNISLCVVITIHMLSWFAKQKLVSAGALSFWTLWLSWHSGRFISSLSFLLSLLVLSL